MLTLNRIPNLETVPWIPIYVISELISYGNTGSILAWEAEGEGHHHQQEQCHPHAWHCLGTLDSVLYSAVSSTYHVLKFDKHVCIQDVRSLIDSPIDKNRYTFYNAKCAKDIALP